MDEREMGQAISVELASAELIPDQRRDDIERLLRYGLGPEAISSALDIPLPTVRAISMFRSDKRLIPEDRELADEARNLAHRALREAQKIMDFGSTDERFRITHLIVSRVMALIGAETTSRMDEIRESFAELTESIRGGDAILEDESEIGAVAVAIDDSD